MSIQQDQKPQLATEQPTKKKGFFSKKIGPVPVWVLIVAIIVVVAIGVNAGKGSSSSPATTTQSSSTSTNQNHSTTTPKWTTTHTFTGNGAKKTEVFSVGNDWKIVWSCSGQNLGGITADGVLAVNVYNSDGTIADPIAVNATCKAGSKPTSDSTEEHQSGSVYLDVNSTGNWTIQIQELK